MKRTLGFIGLFILTSKLCFAEGQNGLIEFMYVMYGLSFIFYTLVGGRLILFVRKRLKYENPRNVKLISYGTAFLLAVLFYILDDMAFLPLYWIT
jgi:peptidoglycan/LPS O-acetylase OafA/YrhL